MLETKRVTATTVYLGKIIDKNAIIMSEFRWVLKRVLFRLFILFGYFGYVLAKKVTNITEIKLCADILQYCQQ